MSTEKTKLIRCFSCKAWVPDIEGPVHAYMDSAPGCWKLYGEILAKEYSPNFYNQNIHRITVDTFAAQHPGKSERRAVQSVNGHLISLYCIFEKKLSGKQATEILKRAVEDKNVANKFLWLDPPDFEKTKHVTDVLIAKSLEEHERLVQAWGDSTWQAWKRKHIQAIESFIVELRV